MTTALLYLLLLVLPFGQLLTINLGSNPIYPLDFLALALSLSLLVEPKHKLLKRLLILKYYFLFTIIAAISLFLNDLITQKFSLSAFAYLARLFVYPSIFFSIINANTQKLSKILKLSLGIFVTIGIIQYLFYPNMTIFKNLGFDDHYYRLVGGLLDPNFTGAILASLTVYLVVSNQLLLSCALTLFLALTFSRASYLSLAIPVLGLAWLTKKAKPLLVILSLVLFVIISPKPFGEGVNLARTFSIYSRVDSVTNAFSVFLDHPLIGVGYNNLSVLGTRVDNSFVFVLATTGLIGGLAFLLFLINIFRNHKTTHTLPLLSLLIHSLFNNSLFYIWIFALFFVYLGLLERQTKD